MVKRGLLCRLDDRGDPVIQLSPPLVADRAVLDEMVSIVGEALEAAWTAYTTRGPGVHADHAAAVDPGARPAIAH